MTKVLRVRVSPSALPKGALSKLLTGAFYKSSSPADKRWRLPVISQLNWKLVAENWGSSFPSVLWKETGIFAASGEIGFSGADKQQAMAACVLVLEYYCWAFITSIQ
ncbi:MULTISPECIES: hypothetical protein [unclassified Coleofasciculus]|uniref:hypothetical protein n=1 Tax=unclassified Coleofasciculus TaxID=2692782 RepID=UPI00187E1CCC|nr:MULTISPECIES: hypothetical protein [unclassified Coleofasciculus]MBE9125403.1 hypothetical protein [Coleofasciculus sp. LEGE 07081]MBE9147380.1 hypothetical protein [Coleofasciculus sp. LEGE 07092]